MVKLIETPHPNKAAEKQYNALVGIDFQKSELLQHLALLLDNVKIQMWKNKHHNSEFSLFEHLRFSNPLVILEGEVGCGKTALAQSIATPLVEKLGGKKIIVFETPSDIRGGGLVGEISNRITAAFEEVDRKLKSNEYGLLIIDEADDIATNRAQNDAHHEDRAGLNVLVKQLDLLARNKKNIGVLLITNRIDVLDPAVRRRASLHLRFDRPRGKQLEDVLKYILQEDSSSDEFFKKAYEFLNKSEIAYSFSDLIQRIARQAILNAVEMNKPLTPEIYWKVLEQTRPTPLL